MTTEKPVVDEKSLELQRAFATFNQVSTELTQAYTALQGRAASLANELAVANGELRRQYEEKENLSERLSALLDALPAGVVQLDTRAVVIALNPTAISWFGQAEGRGWTDLQKQHLSATSTSGEWVMPERGDAVISIAESLLPSLGGKILLLHDITHAHRMKAELSRSQRLAAMGEMAASLAHQLRTPLAAALLYTANLAEPSMEESARQRFAEKATAQLRRLEHLIQDVLLFARGESIGKDRIRIADWLHDAAQTMAPLMQAQSLIFSSQDESEGAEIMGSRKALSGALINLLENAMQATPTGGHVRLSARLEKTAIHIDVTDSGAGIDKAMQERIFEPFFTTKSHGTGLGLAIALGVLRAHGGSLEVNSAEGKGTCFTMCFPKILLPETLL